MSTLITEGNRLTIERYRNISRFSILLIVVSTGGCSATLDSVADSMFDSVVESAVDRIFETKEERHVRKDRKRLRDKKPLKYHKNRKNLEIHERRIEAKKEREEMKERQEKREEEREEEKTREALRIKYDALPAPRLSEPLKKVRVRYNRITEGMPEEEVLEIMGEPTTKGQNTWIYLLNRSEMDATVRRTEIRIRFSKGVVESKKVHYTTALTKKNSQPVNTADREGAAADL